jgi:outer membrane protein OmpA-like peptidoglycan-associated protein
MPFTFSTLSTLLIVGACASKPEGYTALGPGTDIASEMDKTEASLREAQGASLSLLAPKSYKKADEALREAKEDRADNESNEEILESIALSQAHLRQAAKSAEVSRPALATVLEARQTAVDAEADRVLGKKLRDADEDFREIALEIEDDGNLEDAREDGPKLAKKYAELRTESLEKGGRTAETRELRQENQELRSVNTANRETLVAQGQRDDRLKALREKFTSEEAEVIINGENDVVIRLKGLKFPSSRADVPSTSLPLLAKLNEALAEYPAAKVIVEGHTDSVGSAQANQALSQKRAEAVSKYLSESQKADAVREIEALGKGLEEPIRSNTTSTGRAQNRRIDVVIKESAL